MEPATVILHDWVDDQRSILMDFCSGQKMGVVAQLGSLPVPSDR